MFPLTLFLAFSWLSSLTHATSPQNTALQKGIKELKHLGPKEFVALPPRAVALLDRLSCKIPQRFEAPHSTGVISGEFARAGQRDWAVLCDNGSSTSLVLIWGGLKKCVGDLGKLDLKDSFSVNSDGATPAVFMRSIRVAGKQELERARPQTKPIDHVGIFDETNEGTSQIHYCSHGKWKTSRAGD